MNSIFRKMWPNRPVYKKIRNRTDLLNYLIQLKGYRRYLEIGVRNPKNNFKKILIDEKFGVDPEPRRPISHCMTSDAFFEQHAQSAERIPFDLVFVDGLHLAHQVEKDVNHALENLSTDGTIVLHDCNPLTEDSQTVDYGGKKLWNGTVWKAWVKLRATREDLHMQVVAIDHGCGVIRRGRQKTPALASTDFDQMDFNLLNSRRQKLLNLVEVKEFIYSMSGESLA